MQKLIYVVEDEPNIQHLIATTLRTGGYAAKVFGCAEEFFTVLRETIPSLVLLDIMLPGESGLDILKRLRTLPHTQLMPVILLTAKSEEVDKVTGLDLGADDYITKPFGVLELLSRVKVALRHGAQAAQQQTLAPYMYKDIVLDHASKEVRKNGKPIHLTFKEYELLYMLLLNMGIVVSREQLMTTVWGYDFEGGMRTVDVHINSLRQKLGDDAEHPRYIVTVRGHGYKITKAIGEATP